MENVGKFNRRRERNVMRRRNFIRGACLFGAGLLAGPASAQSMLRALGEQGLENPCLSGMPGQLAGHELLKNAFEGISAEDIWDSHAHLAAVGDGHSGGYINPQMNSPLNFQQFVQKRFYLNAACVDNAKGNIDAAYVARLSELLAGFPVGVKAMLFAFDYYHDVQGRSDPGQSTFYVPNAYAAELAHRYPQRFEWVASIHPYRPDAVDLLRAAAANGARAVKWLPPAMGIDPASAQCEKFYAALAQLHLPLISHAGEEKAVKGADRQDYGNPLRLRRALDAGVRVVMAHCGSLGASTDLDRGSHGAQVPNFNLFQRLMDEPRYAGRLFADISAVTQMNRAYILRSLLQRPDWHGRLLNGSDYPLPGVMPLFSTGYLVELGLLPTDSAAVLDSIRRYNPLLFDFVLKRTLRWQGRGFSPSVFETRPFFSTGLA